LEGDTPRIILLKPLRRRSMQHSPVERHVLTLDLDRFLGRQIDRVLGPDNLPRASLIAFPVSRVITFAIAPARSRSRAEARRNRAARS